MTIFVNILSGDDDLKCILCKQTLTMCKNMGVPGSSNNFLLRWFLLSAFNEETFDDILLELSVKLFTHFCAHLENLKF